MRDDLEEIRGDIKVLAAVRAALRDRMASLPDRAPLAPHPGRGRNAGDYVARSVVTREELEGLFKETEESERELERRASQKREELEGLRQVGLQTRIVLDLYYLRGKPWSEVAALTGRSQATCERLRTAAFREIEAREAARAGKDGLS